MTRTTISLPLNTAAITLLVASTALCQGRTGDTESVPHAQPRAAGISQPNVLTPTLLGRSVVNTIAAQGSMPVENPQPTVGGLMIDHYGYIGDGPMIPAYGDVQSTTHDVEATKTEPDKNVYLRLRGQHGADAGYDYGAHFVFQGHESGPRDAAGQARGCITRVNLDADADHRITILTTTDNNNEFLPSFDGITWNPFAGMLLLTGEFGGGTAGGVWMATPDYPSTATDLTGILGHGGYEGIQVDGDGNLWIVEDVGGPRGTVNSHARQPNSFVYRFVPANRGDLSQGGRLQALQVMSLQNQPIVFHAGQPDQDILSQEIQDLHTYGNSFATNWITIHDTAVDGFTPFDANGAAKSHDCTPFKRPENGVFRPGKNFGQFVFTETGDTDSRTEAGSAHGGFGGLFRVSQRGPGDDHGTLDLIYNCDVEHTGFDNITFLTRDLVLVAEDAGDKLHDQRDALDSIWMFDVDADYGSTHAPSPIRVVAEGRDPSATTDAGLSGEPGFQNDGDNEVTGIHVSDGDPSVAGLLGQRPPQPFRGEWRVFWSQQHGDNTLWEISESTRAHDFDRR